MAIPTGFSVHSAIIFYSVEIEYRGLKIIIITILQYQPGHARRPYLQRLQRDSSYVVEFERDTKFSATESSNELNTSAAAAMSARQRRLLLT